MNFRDFKWIFCFFSYRFERLSKAQSGSKRRTEGVERIDELLPQTQCGQCGYPGCRPYAQAIAKGSVCRPHSGKIVAPPPKPVDTTPPRVRFLAPRSGATTCT